MRTVNLIFIPLEALLHNFRLTYANYNEFYNWKKTVQIIFVGNKLFNVKLILYTILVTCTPLDVFNVH